MKPILFLFISVICSFSWAEEALTNLQIQDQIQTQKRIYEEQRAQQEKALLALDAIERKVKSTVLEKSQAQAEIDRMNWAIKNSEQKKLELEQQVQKGKLDLVRRLRTISKISGSDLISGIFFSKNQNDLQRNLKIIQSLASSDRQKILELRSSQQQLTYEITSLEKARYELLNKQSQLQDFEKNYQENFKLKMKLVQGLKKSQIFSRQKIAELQIKKREFQMEDLGILDPLIQVSVTEMKGQLKWPLQGAITTSYGQKLSDEKPYLVKNSGLFIHTKESKKIKPIFDGKVAAIQNIKYLGHVIVLDHGDHVYSVYASSSAPQVSAGDLVKTNSVLATTNFVPAFKQSGLYFEIRHYNQPQNPMDWMKGSTL